MSHSGFRVMLVVGLIWGATIAAFDVTAPLWAKHQLHASPRQLGSIQAISGFISIAASLFLVTYLVDRVGKTRALAMSFLIVSLASMFPLVDMLMELQGNFVASQVFLFATYAVKAFGVESCFAGQALLFMDSVPESLRAAAQGAESTVVNIGFAVGPMWGAALYAFSVTNYILPGALPFIGLVCGSVLL